MANNKMKRDDAVQFIKWLYNNFETRYPENINSYLLKFAKSESEEDINQVKADFWRWISNI